MVVQITALLETEGLMSARSAIPKALAEGMAAAINGSAPYVENLYGNVINKVTHFEDIQNFPTVGITPGPESRVDQPSNFTLCYVDIYIRIYVKNNNDAQAELERIISDIETYVDDNQRLQYSVDTPLGGSDTDFTISNSIASIATDEGLLEPLALGEIVLQVEYRKLR